MTTPTPTTAHEDAAARHLDMAARALQKMPDAREVHLLVLQARQALIVLEMNRTEAR